MNENKVFARVVLENPTAANVQAVAANIASSLESALSSFTVGDLFKGVEESAKRSFGGVSTEAQKAKAGVDSFERSMARMVAGLLPANNALQKQAGLFLQNQAAAGKTEQEIIDLARATGAFTSAEIKAAAEVGDLTRALREQTNEFIKTGNGAGKIQESLGRITDRTKALATQSQATGRNLISFGGVLQGVGTALGVLGLIDAIRKVKDFGLASIQASIAFESGFAGIVKTVDGVVDKVGNLTAFGERLRVEFKQLAQEIPVAVAELLKIGEIGGQLGIANKDLERFTELIAKLDVTTNISGEGGALQFAQFGNVLQLTQDELERTAAAIVELGNNTATTESHILNFSRRIAGAGSALGLTASEITGIAAAFSSAGVEAEAGGTAVQKTLFEINEAVQDGGDRLDKIAALAGVTSEQFAQLFKDDPAVAFAATLEAIGQQGDEAIATLGELISTDVRLTRSIINVAQSGDLLASSIDLANDAFRENTALTTEAELRFDTTESAVQRMSNAWEIFKVNLGDSAPIKEAVNAVSGLVEGINNLNNLESILDNNSNVADGLGAEFRAASSAVGFRRKPDDDVPIRLALPTDEQLDRALILSNVLENLSQIPDFQFPLDADGIRELINEIELLNGGVDEFISKQQLLGAGADQGFAENLSAGLSAGLISVAEFNEALALLSEAQGQNAAAVIVSGDAYEVYGQAFEGYADSSQRSVELGALLAQSQLEQMRTTEALTDSTTELDDKQARIAQATLRAEQAQKKLTKALLEQIEAAADTSTVAGELALGLVKEAEAAGVTGEALLDLARATGLLTDDEADAVQQKAELAVEQARLIALVQAGQLTWAEAAAQLNVYASALGVATGAALDLASAQSAFGGGFVGSIENSVSQGGGSGGSGGGKSAAEIAAEGAKEAAEIAADVADVAEEAADDAREAADNAAEVLEGIVSSFAETVRNMVDARQALDDAIAEGADGEEIDKLKQDLADATTFSQEFNAVLFDMSETAGGNVTQLVALAQATGLLNEEQAKAALSMLATEQALKAIASAYVSGAITAEEAATAVGTLEEQIANGQDIDLGAKISISNVDDVEGAAAIAEANAKSLEAIAKAADIEAVAAKSAAEELRKLADAQDTAAGSAGTLAKKADDAGLALLKAGQAAGLSASDLLGLAKNAGFNDEALLSDSVIAGFSESLNDLIVQSLQNVEGFDGALAGQLQEEILGELESLQSVLSAEELALFVDLALDPERSLGVEDINEALALLGASDGVLPIEAALRFAEDLEQEGVNALIAQLEGGADPLTLSIDGDTTEAEADADALEADIEGRTAVLGIEAEDSLARAEVDEFVAWVEQQEAKVQVVGNAPKDSDAFGGDSSSGSSSGGSSGGSGGGSQSGAGGGVQEFHTGGVVGGGLGREVPAKLLGGEGVLNLRAMQNLPSGVLDSLNRGETLETGGISQLLAAALGQSVGLAPVSSFSNEVRVDRSVTNHVNNNNYHNLQPIEPGRIVPLWDVGGRRRGR